MKNMTLTMMMKIRTMIGEFDIIFMSSVIHEIESFEGNINKTKIFDNIHNLLKVGGIIIIRDWGFSKSKMKSPETIMITSKDALEEVRIWIKALYDNNIIQPYEINEEDLEIKVYKKSDVYEIIFHSVSYLRDLAYKDWLIQVIVLFLQSLYKLIDL